MILKIINIWLKIILEVVIYLIIFFVGYILIWWITTFIGQNIFSCTFTDTGFLKQAYIQCGDKSFPSTYFQYFAQLLDEIFLFMFLFLFFIIGFGPVVIPIFTLIISILIGVNINSKGKEMKIPMFYIWRSTLALLKKISIWSKKHQN